MLEKARELIRRWGAGKKLLRKGTLTLTWARLSAAVPRAAAARQWPKSKRICTAAFLRTADAGYLEDICA